MKGKKSGPEWWDCSGPQRALALSLLDQMLAAYNHEIDLYVADLRAQLAAGTDPSELVSTIYQAASTVGHPSAEACAWIHAVLLCRLAMAGEPATASPVEDD